MEKSDNTQLELFSAGASATQPSPERANPFFFRLRSHEKSILIMMALVVTGVISFSLGVEKGKHISMLGSTQRMDVAQVKIPQEAPAKITPAQQPAQPVQEVPREGYVIQLASYKTRVTAQKEAESLKKRGLSPLVLSKGSYAVLYVAGFPNREKAKLALGELKKRFKDCYVRRL